MISDIVSKLNKHLSQSVETECSVVYLLAEVRKILEKDTQDPETFALRMYCHWALHVDLTYRNTTKHLLEKVDIFVLNNSTTETNLTVGFVFLVILLVGLGLSQAEPAAITLTGAVVVWYTYETMQLKREMERQTALMLKPYIVARPGGGSKKKWRFELTNIETFTETGWFIRA